MVTNADMDRLVGADVKAAQQAEDEALFSGVDTPEPDRALILRRYEEQFDGREHDEWLQFLLDSAIADAALLDEADAVAARTGHSDFDPLDGHTPLFPRSGFPEEHREVREVKRGSAVGF